MGDAFRGLEESGNAGANTSNGAETGSIGEADAASCSAATREVADGDIDTAESSDMQIDSLEGDFAGE